MVNLYGFELNKIGEAEYEVKNDYQGSALRIFAEEKLLTKMDEEVFIQARNVAQLPGLVGPTIIMADAHSGYGAPIGTVFAMDANQGYVSPGAVGYDINCGMRLISTNLTLKDAKDQIERLMNLLFDYIPAGIGRKGFLQINKKELGKLLTEGVGYLVKNKGIGWDKDLENIEES